jgi:2-keto-4-pentenoate hydratase
MTGALGPMQSIGPSDTVVASFGDLGTVTTHVSPA